jgi:hypothetical protein
MIFDKEMLSNLKAAVEANKRKTDFVWQLGRTGGLSRFFVPNPQPKKTKLTAKEILNDTPRFR